jgi:hypothetical protein
MDDASAPPALAGCHPPASSPSGRDFKDAISRRAGGVGAASLAKEQDRRP